MNKEKIKRDRDSNSFGCGSCGAYLKYKPGTQYLNCEYCGTENEIRIPEQEIEEQDYNSFFTGETIKEVKIVQDLIKCESCTTTITLNTTISSAICPFCSTPLIIEKAFKENAIQPKSLLPFVLDTEPAKQEFKKWIKKLWFAPGNLNKLLHIDNFNGIYIPFWTYDTLTVTKYKGARGEHYYVNESYTTTENGKSVTKTRSVRKTRWYGARGTVKVLFDDLLVSATKSLPEKHLKKLEPWDIENLVPFDAAYISGYITEKYQVTMEEGFKTAKKLLEDDVDLAIRRSIGGDEQRIDLADTTYFDVKFKHVLFPVYVSVYKYNNKLYQFFINARTGEVQGERPYSWLKIFMAIFVVLAVIAVIVYYVKYHNTSGWDSLAF